MTLWQDLRYALRRLVRDRSLTLMAVAALGLGIGANATVFSLVHAVFIRGLPFDEPGRIVNVSSRDSVRGSTGGVSLPDFEDYREAAASFRGLAAFTAGGTANLSDADNPPERVTGSLVTPNTFRLLGQPVLLGRDFLPEEGGRGADRTVILGYRVWQDRYAADPGVLGRVVRVNDEPSTIVGVMPEGMRFPLNSDTWRPLQPTDALDRRDNRMLSTVGRLAPGVDLHEADAEVRALAGRLRQQHPDTNEHADAFVQTFNDWANPADVELIVPTLMGAVAFVLLIACANVANLLLARSARRAREVAIRVAQGATRWRIVRQLLVESLLLGAAGGAAGLGLAGTGIRLLDVATADVGKPFWMTFHLDGAVVAFLVLACVGTSVLFGFAPALHVSKTPVGELLHEGGRTGAAGGMRARRLAAAMVVVEVTLAVVLLAGAGLFVRSFQELYRIDLGFDPARVLTGQITLVARKYPGPEDRVRFVKRLQRRLDAMPGTRAASVATTFPLFGGLQRSLEIDGRPSPDGAPAPTVTMLSVGARYFESLGVSLTRGRALTLEDGREGAESVVVNARLAARFFPGEDPLGRRIRLQAQGQPPGPWLTIVGVSPSVRQLALQERDPDPVVYLPYRLYTGGPAALQSSLAIQVLTAGNPAGFVPELREAVQAVDPELPVFGARSMAGRLEDSRWTYLLFSGLFGIFTAIALILSAVGIYAVTAYSVMQRTQEIGIRMALGALPGQVIWVVMRRGLAQVGAGLMLGAAGAFAVGRLIESLLVQTSPRDPATLAAVLAVLAAATVAACVGPARRAVGIDPVEALRFD